MPSTSMLAEPSNEARSQVLLPDIFKPFPSHKPNLHPDYAIVKAESEQWLAQYLSLDSKAQAKLARADFTYFTTVWMADASREAFRIAADWMNWAFEFDDEFEVGSLKNNPDRAKAAVDAVLATTTGDVLRSNDGSIPPISLGILQAHADVCRRLNDLGSDVIVQRYRRSMDMYTEGVLGQIQDSTEHRERTIDEMIYLRRYSLGILPCFVLLQAGLDTILPDCVVDHPLVREVEILSTDLVIIHNDIVSYAKEESEDVVHNLIACCRLQGMTNQESFDFLDKMLDARIDRLDAISKSLPSWGAEVDVVVAKYVQGCEDMVLSNIEWSFRSERYFGSRKDEVRKTRLIELLDDPPYLQRSSFGASVYEA